MRNFNCNNLLENMNLAFAYNKAIYDENKNPKDFIILDVNKKFEEITGFKKNEIIQEKGFHILENIFKNPNEMIQSFEEVASNGKSKSFEVCSDNTGNWYEVNVFSEKEGYFTTIFNDISDRKGKEEKLKEKTDRLNSIYNNFDDIIYSLSWPDLQVKLISREIKDIVGYTVGEFKANSGFLKKITHQDDKYIHDEALNTLKENGFAKREFRIITKKGNIRWISDKGKMIYEDNNNPVRIEGIMRNITEKKIAANKLKYSQRMYETIFESAPIGIILEDKNGDIIKVNEAECEMTGYSKDELIGSNVKDKFVLPENQVKSENDIKKILKGKDLKQDVKTSKKNGEIFYEHIKETVITFPDGGKVILSMHIDITERKKKVEKINSQKKRMENTIEATEAGTFEWNVQTGKAILNEKWAELIGYTLEEILPHNFETWKKFTHPDDLEKCKRLLKGHFNGQKDQYKVEIRMKHKEGRWIWVLAQGKVVSWTEDREPLKMFGTHIDITERIKSLKALKFQHEFQKTLSDISYELVGISEANFDDSINNSLKKIGQFFEIDRSYIFQFSDDKKYITNTHEWTVDKITSEKANLQNLSIVQLPWLKRKLYNTEVVNIYDVEQLEEEAKSEKKIFQEENIKSLVIIPIFIRGEIWGFFGFDKVKEKHNFNKKEIDKLKIVADVIKSAVLQYLYIKNVKKLTYKDSLTELYNRRYFEEETERLDTKRQLPISIIMVDINGLKIINDSYGHETGDQMLIETGKILKDHIRDEDILARHGGDEFTILLPKTPYKEAEKIVSRLKNKEHKITNEGITISSSLGFATKVNENENIREILKEADDDMYRNKLSESRSNKNKLVQNLLYTLEVKSSETKNHAVRMTRLARELGEEIGLSTSELNKLSLIATLHDIGKATISEDILTKSEKLTEKEWEIIKEHPVRGYKIASASEEFAEVAKEILCHHEHWNGNGYPEGMKRENIPYLARIISIIDAYDVMTNERPYSEAISKKEALTEIEECAGKQFDPEIARKFIELQENNL